MTQSIDLFDIRNWVVVVTGSAVEVIGSLADILAQTGAHVYVCQPFLSDNDVPSEDEHSSQVFVNMDETNKLSIANAVRVVETRERHINLLINVNAGESSQGKRGSWDSFFNRTGSHSVSQQTHEVEDWDRVFGTNISSSYFIASAFGSLLRAGAECHGTGCVINVSRPGKTYSQLAPLGGYPLPTMYGTSYSRPSASDTALQQLNNLLAAELNQSSRFPERVRVNAVVLRQPAVTSCAVAQSVISCAANSFIHGTTICLE
ncbi:Short chain dehydrogenase/reductase [Ceratobasidium theobromae]|uniref:Short chain dehydrogenase/reductase n=1 Tax=Ceratobasidium theobromae TaxID=1582974 RepID=A0A5N5QI11_9AGAM|nr:Short chain dehydrogenase/reductase [Ceratobasidium theobromae]